jgi:ParB-like chromosome segregation protein Spo0J
MRTANTSSLPPGDDRLVRVPLTRLHPHPATPNQMTDEQLETLTRNIERAGGYQPIVVRPHPEVEGDYQSLDGWQRITVLPRLGHADLLCYVWPCDDETALVLLATLNRLHGEDVPAKRAELLAELTSLMPVSELALLLPEEASQIDH